MSFRYKTFLKEFSFDYLKTSIVIYRKVIIQYANMNEKNEGIYEGHLLPSSFAFDKWKDIVGIIVNRNPKTSLLYRRSPSEIIKWACQMVIDNNDFEVKYTSRNDLKFLNSLTIPL